jgi:hypothetical protein
MVSIFKCIFSSLLVAVVIGLSVPVNAQDTRDYPWTRPDGWMSQIISSPTGGAGQGHIGVDVSLGEYPGTYNPCHNASDAYVGACDSPGSYYKVQRYRPGTNDFPFGIFIDSSNAGQDHHWAKRMKTVYLEIYPYSIPVNAPLDGYRLDPGACGCTVVGGMQVVIDDWKGGYSANIGQLSAPALGDSGVGKMNGFVRRGSTPLGANEVNVDWFAQDTTTTRSSTGYPVRSFASWPTNQDGYYTSGPVVNGNYKIFVTEKATGKKVECVGIKVAGVADRLDMDLSQLHYGLDSPVRQCYDR